MDPRLEIAALTGRIAFHVGKEKLTRPRPTSLRDVPPSVEHLTNEWLTLALCEGRARVVDHRLHGRDDGTSSRCRIEVTYDSDDPALPRHLFTKSGPTFKTRLVSAAADLSKIESAFYGLIRPTLDIEAPPTRYSAYDPVSNRQLLLVDDLAATEGAEFGTVLTRTLTKEQAEQVIDVLASLHVAFWGQPLQQRFGTWLRPAYEWQARLNVTIGAEKRIASGFERGADVIPPRLAARQHEVQGALMRSLELNAMGPQTMLHGDLHPGNWYVTRDGRMGLCDWQCIVQGGWERDIAYAISSALPPEDRRAWEQDLVTRHGERLREAGIADAPSPDEAFHRYRQAMPHAMFMWLATLGRHPLQDELQQRDIVLELVRRICIAADDLETLDAIAEGRPAARPAVGV